MGFPFLSAQWNDVAALTFRVDPALVAPHLPHGVDADLDDGAAVVSLVAFSFCNTTLLGAIPAPFHQRFSEVNLRIYVQRDGERAVTFVREYVPRQLVTAVAHIFFNEPYRTIPGGARTFMENAGGQSIRHVVHRFGLDWRYGIDVWAKDEPAIPSEDSLERRLTHHTVGFGRRHDGATLAYRVHHPVWPLYPVVRHRLHLDVERLYGAKWAPLMDMEPFARTLALGSKVDLSPPSTLATFDQRRSARAKERAPLGVPARPVLLFDGECGICTQVGSLVQGLDKDAQIDIAAIRSPIGDRLLGDLDPAVREGSWHLVLPDGRRFREADALPELMALLPGFSAFAGAARLVPSSLSNPLYRAIAARRQRISRLVGVRACKMPVL